MPSWVVLSPVVWRFVMPKVKQRLPHCSLSASCTSPSHAFDHYSGHAAGCKSKNLVFDVSVSARCASKAADGYIANVRVLQDLGSSIKSGNARAQVVFVVQEGGESQLHVFLCMWSTGSSYDVPPQDKRQSHFNLAPARAD